MAHILRQTVLVFKVPPGHLFFSTAMDTSRSDSVEGTLGVYHWKSEPADECTARSRLWKKALKAP